MATTCLALEQVALTQVIILISHLVSRSIRVVIVWVLEHLVFRASAAHLRTLQGIRSEVKIGSIFTAVIAQIRPILFRKQADVVWL